MKKTSVILIVITALLSISILNGCTSKSDDHASESNDFISDSTKDIKMTSVVFELIPKEGQKLTDEGIEDTIRVLTRRVNDPEANVYKVSDNKIRIDIPGNDDPNEIIRLYGSNGNLNFRNGAGEIKMDSTVVREAFVSIDPDTGKPVAMLSLTDEGKKLFKSVTGEIASSADKTLAIYFGDSLVSSPTVESAIDGESGVMIQSDSFASNPRECEALVNCINAGVLYYTLVAEPIN